MKTGNPPRKRPLFLGSVPRDSVFLCSIWPNSAVDAMLHSSRHCVNNMHICRIHEFSSAGLLGVQLEGGLSNAFPIAVWSFRLMVLPLMRLAAQPVFAMLQAAHMFPTNMRVIFMRQPWTKVFPVPGLPCINPRKQGWSLLSISFRSSWYIFSIARRRPIKKF